MTKPSPIVWQPLTSSLWPQTKFQADFSNLWQIVLGNNIVCMVKVGRVALTTWVKVIWSKHAKRLVSYKYGIRCTQSIASCFLSWRINTQRFWHKSSLSLNPKILLSSIALVYIPPRKCNPQSNLPRVWTFPFSLIDYPH